MNKITTFFLKLAVILIGIPILAFCIFLAPKIGDFVGDLYPNTAYLKALVLILLYGAALPFYFALFQAFNLLRYIEANTAFSHLSVKALKTIKGCAITISGWYILGMPLFHLVGEKVDPPVGFVGFIIIFGSLVIAVFAAVLQNLLQEAIHIKSENDLTV